MWRSNPSLGPLRRTKNPPAYHDPGNRGSGEPVYAWEWYFDLKKCNCYAHDPAQGAVLDTSAGFSCTSRLETRLRELEVRDALVLLHVPQERLLLVVAVELHAQRGDDALSRDGALLRDQLAVLDAADIELVQEIMDGVDIDELMKD